MYSQPWSPTPSTTAVAPELRTQNRSPRRRAGRSRRDVAPYAIVLPAMICSSARERRRPVGADDDPAAGEALADVVVGVALEPQRDAPRQERAERLAGRAR